MELINGDSQLMENLKTGNMDVFNAIYEGYYNDVMNYVYRVSGGNGALAEDITQNVFMNLWTYRNGHYSKSRIKPLLITMARNALINASKKEALGKTKFIEKQSSSSSAVVAEPHQKLAKEELKKTVEGAVAALPDPIREVLILSRYHCLKNKEIAQILNVSVRTIEERISRAFEQLEGNLKPLMEE